MSSDFKPELLSLCVKALVSLPSQWALRDLHIKHGEGHTLSKTPLRQLLAFQKPSGYESKFVKSLRHFKQSKFFFFFLPGSTERRKSWWGGLRIIFCPSILIGKNIPISKWPNDHIGKLLIMKNYFKIHIQYYKASWMKCCKKYVL